MSDPDFADDTLKKIEQNGALRLREVRDSPQPRPVRLDQPALPTVSVVIPTLNESTNIPWVLERMPAVDELIVVDGCSADNTVELVLAHRPDAKIIVLEPTGKGAAMRAGFEAASQDVVIAMDGDGSMNPQEIVAFISLFQMGFDLVKGSRRAIGGGSTDFTPLRRTGNRGLVAAYNVLFGGNLSDLCYGYLGFRRDCLPALGLYADGFEIESQILAHASLAGLRIGEVPSIERPRISGESNLHTFRDGARALRALARARFSPGREMWRERAMLASGVRRPEWLARDESA